MCVIVGLVLSHVPARHARQVVAGYADLLALGSCVTIPCGRCVADGPSAAVRTRSLPLGHAAGMFTASEAAIAI